MKKNENKLTTKQTLTIIICLLIILIVCLFLVKENKKLVKEHPEYSVQGVSSERQASAEELFNKILADGGEKVSKDSVIYKLKGDIKENILFSSDIESEKLISALNNSTHSTSYGIPDDIKLAYYNSAEDSLYQSSLVTFVSKESLQTTYKDMYGETLTNFANATVNCKEYLYSNSSNKYYLKSVNCADLNNVTYYIYYDGYNSPYEHHDVATVNVSILGITKESDSLYRIVNIYGDEIEKHLTFSEATEYINNVDNYAKVKSFEVNYKFNNDSSYGLNFTEVK